MHVPLAVSIALVLATHTTTPVESRAAAAVTAFYRFHMPEAQSGLLDGAALERHRPFLSRTLYQRYAEAIRRQQDWVRRQQSATVKPPCIEGGDHFDSLSERPDVQSAADDPIQMFEVTRTEAGRPNETWRVAVKFWFDTTPRVEWTDTIRLSERLQSCNQE